MNFSLSVLPLSIFTSVSSKTLGSRPGAIGKFANSDDLYMVKYEGYGYDVCVVGKNTENDIVESFTAQLIRDIWGRDYATDINLAYADTILPHMYEFLKIPHTQTAVAVRIPYMVASLIENNAIPVSPYVFQHEDIALNRQYSKILTIAKLVGVADFKCENLIYNQKNNHLMFVDCAANFNYFKKADDLNDLFSVSTNTSQFFKNIDKDTVMKTIADFVNYQGLASLIGEYSHYLSSSTQRKIIKRLTFLMDICKVFLSQLKANTTIAQTSAMLFSSDTLLLNTQGNDASRNNDHTLSVRPQ